MATTRPTPVPQFPTDSTEGDAIEDRLHRQHADHRAGDRDEHQRQYRRQQGHQGDSAERRHKRGD